MLPFGCAVSVGLLALATPQDLCRSLQIASHNDAPILRQQFALRVIGHTTAEMFVVIMPSASLLAVACTGAVPSASPALFSRMSTCHGQLCFEMQLHLNTEHLRSEHFID